MTRKRHRAVCSLLAAAALAISTASSAGQGWELGDAPQRAESQDASSWKAAPIPKAATREAAAALYHSAYVPGEAVALNWTGSIAGCDSGTTNLDHQQAVIDRVNYFRLLVGLPAVTLLGVAETSQVQAAALMLSANNALSHMPPTNWLCYSTAGANGAAKANIVLGRPGAAAINLYVDDPGPGNSAAGHRRWILFPPRAAMATGDVSGGNMPPRPANALYVFGPSATRPATPNGIAWPPAGFVPYQNLPSQSNRWSLSFPGADFSNANVVMTGAAGVIPVTVEPLANGFGDNTILFVPTGVSYDKPAADTTYEIEVSGIAGANVPALIRYTVTIIDPDVSTGAATANYQGLWWKSPAGSESGWGMNIAHQGDVIFLTWFTYDSTGRAWWVSMTATRQADGRYSGTLYQTRGPAFNSVPFDPMLVTATPVGTGTLSFSNDANSGDFAYTLNGVTQSKRIERQVFGPLPVCTFGVQSNLALATNYQDLWWAAPPGAESGWGINFTHQGDTIFATWFTYDLDSAPLWLSATVQKSAPGTYSGTLYRTTGPAFSAVPFSPAAVTVTQVGTVTLAFTDGNTARFTYNVNGELQFKQITRQVFRAPGTVCQ